MLDAAHVLDNLSWPQIGVGKLSVAGYCFCCSSLGVSWAPLPDCGGSVVVDVAYIRVRSSCEQIGAEGRGEWAETGDALDVHHKRQQRLAGVMDGGGVGGPMVEAEHAGGELVPNC